MDPPKLAVAEDSEGKRILASVHMALIKTNLTATSAILLVPRRRGEPEILVNFSDIYLAHIAHVQSQSHGGWGGGSMPAHKLQRLLGILFPTSVLKRLGFKRRIFPYRKTL